MRLVRYYPNTRFESEIGRLFDSAFTGFAGLGNRAFPVEFDEDNDNSYIRAELPGVKREDIKVEIEDGTLSLTATRRQPGDGEQGLTLSRSFTLPEPVEAAKVTASCADGILTITLPKPEQAKPQKVAVEVR